MINKPQTIPEAPFQNTLTSKSPDQLTSLDFVGPFKNGFHMMTIIDYFSKHYLLRYITAMNAVHAMFDSIISFGLPELILSDNGKQFYAHTFYEFHKILGVNLRYTTMAHP